MKPFALRSVFLVSLAGSAALSIASPFDLKPLQSTTAIPATFSLTAP